MNLPPIILSIAFGYRYVVQQRRMVESAQRTNPGVDVAVWTDEYPPGSRSHSESLYGFKVHAVQWALERGYKRIIWLDTACVLQHSIEPWFVGTMPPVIAVRDDNALTKCIADKALAYYGNPDITGRHLVGGSLYVFDFIRRNATHIFNKWAEAERMGVFGSQAEQAGGKINKHRHDESCMAMALYDMNVPPLTHDEARYNQDENSIIRKYHFK